MKGKEDVFVGSLFLRDTRVYSCEESIGDDGLSTLVILVHYCVEM